MNEVKPKWDLFWKDLKWVVLKPFLLIGVCLAVPFFLLAKLVEDEEIG